MTKLYLTYDGTLGRGGGQDLEHGNAWENDAPSDRAEALNWAVGRARPASHVHQPCWHILNCRPPPLQLKPNPTCYYIVCNREELSPLTTTINQ